MSDYQSALAKARAMREIILDHGAPEVSIELRPGRPNSYGVWDAGFFVADMSHHTVSRLGENRTPCLGLIKYGRSDLPGPLANGYGGYDLTYRIITFGYANHPGEGGSYTVPALNAGRFTIPKDSARRYAWGTEWEGGLSSRDWDQELTNPRNGKKMTMREFMGRVNAALEVALEIHRDAHMEHSTWTSRKIDRLGYNKERGILEKLEYRNPEPPKPPLPGLQLKVVRNQFRKFLDLEKGKPEETQGIELVQKALKDRYEVKLKADGLVGQKTVDAWGKHEERIGVKGRPLVPDAATLANLGKGHFVVNR